MRDACAGVRGYEVGGGSRCGVARETVRCGMDRCQAGRAAGRRMSPPIPLRSRRLHSRAQLALAMKAHAV